MYNDLAQILSANFLTYGLQMYLNKSTPPLNCNFLFINYCSFTHLPDCLLSHVALVFWLLPVCLSPLLWTFHLLLTLFMNKHRVNCLFLLL